MAINFPDNRQQVIDRIKTDVQAELPQSNPFLRASFYGSLMVGYGGRVYEVYLQLIELLKQMFMDTATGDYLKRWGYYVDVTINSATIAEGFITAVGTPGASIPVGTQFQAGSDNTYTSQSSVTIAANSNSITSLTNVAGAVTAITVGNHNFASNIFVTISGANQTAYNGTYKIFVTSENSFTYQIDSSPVTPATGTILAAANTASVFVKSDDFGESQNLASGAALTVTSPLAGVDSTMYVQFDAIAGGTADENIENFRTRVIDTYQHPNTPFNNDEIEQLAKTINGVTRVFIQNPDTTQGDYAVVSLTQSGGVATATFTDPHGLISGMYISISGALPLGYNVQDVPILVTSSTSFIFLVSSGLSSPATGTIYSHFAQVQPGQVKVFFTRDNDTNIIPTPTEVAAVKAKLLTIKPAHTNAADLIVEAPTALPITFNFDEIVPDTLSMRNAIIANLEEFFTEPGGVSVGQTLLAKAYNTAIFTTIDPETGIPLQNYVLTSPSGDITVEGNELPTYNTSNF